MLEIIITAEQAISHLNRLYKNSAEKYGMDNTEFTIPALAALRDVERVKNYLKEISTYIG